MPQTRKEILKTLRLPIIGQVSLKCKETLEERKLNELGDLLNDDLKSKFLPTYKMVHLCFDYNSKKNKKLRKKSLPSELRPDTENSATLRREIYSLEKIGNARRYSIQGFEKPN
jgi:hypothetical protein